MAEIVVEFLRRSANQVSCFGKGICRGWTSQTSTIQRHFLYTVAGFVLIWRICQLFIGLDLLYFITGSFFNHCFYKFKIKIKFSFLSLFSIAVLKTLNKKILLVPQSLHTACLDFGGKIEGSDDRREIFPNTGRCMPQNTQGLFGCLTGCIFFMAWDK